MTEQTNPTPEAQGEWRERARYRGGVPLIDSLVNLLDDLEAKLAAANDLVRAMVEAQKTSEAHWRKEVEEVTTRNEQLLQDGQHWLTVGRDNDELTERLAEVTAERDNERDGRNWMLKIVDDREARIQAQEQELTWLRDQVRDLTAETFRLGDWIEQLEGASIQ